MVGREECCAATIGREAVRRTNCRRVAGSTAYDHRLRRWRCGESEVAGGRVNNQGHRGVVAQAATGSGDRQRISTSRSRTVR